MTGTSPLSAVEATLGAEMLEKIQTSKILLVGAGGIGCELLKNLALSGFRHVETIDLDTIDVSNLNRQFLFRSHHVGQSKCVVASQVAKEMMMPFSDDASYIAHHGNVCDNAKFNVQYVSNFNLVLNALDNVAARRRVNRLCLAAGVPLVEAGTTGYLGQVKVIDKTSNVACYECATQETQKVYPICTIRSTPSMPVHCIVWAKELYKLLFGDKVEDSMLYEDTTAEGGEPSTYMSAVLQYRSFLQSNAKQQQQECYSLARDILLRLFVDEIDKQLAMGRFKTAKKTPAPLAKDDIATGTRSDKTPPTQRPNHSSTDVWSPVDCMAEFAACLAQADPSTVLPQFDKDDGLAMRFVTAASNLRSHVFGIEPIQSYYSAKGIAGNIVPAIATTNAICAGLQLLQVFSILRAQLEGKADALADACRYLDVTRHRTGRSQFYISSSRLDPPNPKCFVCRNATIPLTLHVPKWTLQRLLDVVIKKELGFEEPTILLEGDVIYEEGEGADTQSFRGNLDKTLDRLPCGGMQHGTMFRVEDFSQDLEVDVCVHHKEVWEREEGDDEESDLEKYLIGGDKPQAKPVAEPTSNGVAKKPTADENGGNNSGDDDDEIEIIENDEPDSKVAAIDSKPAASSKRMTNGYVAEADEASGGPRKKRKTEDNGDHEVIVID